MAEANGLKLGDAMQPIRVALTGSTVSEPVNELLEVVGPERSLARMREVADRERGSRPPREGRRGLILLVVGARRHAAKTPPTPPAPVPSPDTRPTAGARSSGPRCRSSQPPPPRLLAGPVRLAFTGDINLGTLTVPGRRAAGRGPRPASTPRAKR